MNSLLHWLDKFMLQVVVVLTLAVSAEAHTFVLAPDGDMNVSNYNLGASRVVKATSFSPSLSNVTTGNPGDALNLNINFTAQTGTGFVIQAVDIGYWTYDPSADGELTSLSLSGDFNSTGGVAVSLGLVQDGVAYWTHPHDISDSVNGTAYESVDFSDVTASNFSPIDGSTGFPDFRPTGGEITFAYVIRRGDSGAGYRNFDIGTDNVSLSVETLPTADLYGQRRDWILGLTWPQPTTGTAPKQGMPLALANLYQTDGADATSRQYTADSHDPSVLDAGTFDAVGIVRAIYMFRDSFTATQMDAIEDSLRDTPKWTGGGTENHRLMRWTNGYLLAQEFGGNWYPESETDPKVSAQQLMATLKDKLIEEGKFRYQNGGMSEYLSPNYLNTHIQPLLNLYDFAEDPEMRDVAEAMLHLHTAHLALNVHKGYMLEPHARLGGKQHTSGPDFHNNGAQFLAWLYFGQMDRPQSLIQQMTYLVPLSLSNFRPHAILTDVANGTNGVSFPYFTQSASMNWPHQGDRLPRTDLRSVYRASSYSIGTGYFEHVPHGYYMQHSKFGIAWDSTDPLAFLTVGHPYWRTDSGQAQWWLAPGSPFQQMAHHENTVIAVYNIPEADPWPNSGRSDWIEERDGHASDLIKEAMVGVPYSIDERVEYYLNGVDNTDGSWRFLREGDTYIGILILTESRTPAIGPDQFRIMADAEKNGDRYQTALIFEVGTQAEHETFTDFQTQLKSNTYTVDWGTGTVPTPDITYTDSQGDELRIRYNNNLTPDSGGIVRNRPEVWMDGTLLDFSSWPDISGPEVSLDHGVLTVNSDGKGQIIDWNGTVPSINRFQTVISEDFEDYSTGNLVGQKSWNYAVNTSSPKIINTNGAYGYDGKAVSTRKQSSSDDYAIKAIPASTLHLGNDVIVEITASRSAINSSGVMLGFGNGQMDKAIGITSSNVFFREGWGRIERALDGTGAYWNDMDSDDIVVFRSVWDLSQNTATLAVKNLTKGETEYTTLYFDANQTQDTVLLGDVSDINLWDDVFVRFTGTRHARLYSYKIQIK